jgi:predicted nucleic acid-binding protein
MASILIDTNVMVYAYDRREPAKQPQAIRVLERLRSLRAGSLSVQCLAEFFRVVTRGARPMLPLDEATRQLEALALGWPTFDLSIAIVIEASRGVRVHRLAYWDAQLWATARLNQVPVIFSEDFTSGTSLEGIRFIDPFAPRFDLDTWA